MSTPYKMTINLNALNHLGINLYSNVPAVVSEIIANAWDADATEVHISITNDLSSVTITDNGIGMTRDDINDKFLNVGYEKRKNGESITAKGRKSMGRKGIGKLSIFSIANVAEVYSRKDGETNAFTMRVDDIKHSIESGEPAYAPEPIDNPTIKDDISTKIVLKSLKKGIHGLKDFLAKRIARRFGVLGEQHDFQVFINGKPVSISDRDYFHKLEYIWCFGTESEKYKTYCGDKLKESTILANTITIDTETYPVFGWLGLVEHSYELQEDNESINKITVLVRDKLAQEDILEEFGEGGIYTKYLIGEIYADFLDLDELDDIATSSRQKIIEDDPRYIALKGFLQEHLKTVQTKRAEYKETDGTKKALEYPSVKEWFSTLKGDTKKKAKKLFGKINQIETENLPAKAELFKQGVLAFEKLRHKETLDTLVDIELDQFEAYTKALADFDDFEALHYYEITSGRLKVIEIFNGKVDANVLEKHLQRYLFDHLWLLDPSWERGTQTPIMEEQVHKAFDEISEKLSDEEKNGRVDIRYQMASGKHIIIELKRASVKTTTFALQEQVDKYMKALRKQLATMKKEHEPIEAYCILGQDPINWDTPEEKEKGQKALKEHDIYIMNYKELVDSSYELYKEYLATKRETSKIQKILNDIEQELLEDTHS